MNTVCFGFYNSTLSHENGLQNPYAENLKKIISFFYANPDYQFTMYIDGLQFELLEKDHKELLVILKELTVRKQLELLGGGYYNPVFPLILPVDRVGQTELLTTHLRKKVGKKPNGAWIQNSFWESSLVSSFTNCGIDFVLLDAQFIDSKNTPLIVEDLGKSLYVLPLYTPNVQKKYSAERLYKKLLHVSSQNNNGILCCFFDIATQSIDFELFNQLYDIIKTHNVIEASLPSKYVKSAPYVKKAFLNAKKENQIRTFLLDFPETLHLYSKMMYTSSLISQCRGDRIRKNAAREELWKAQNYNAYTAQEFAKSHKLIRQNTYTNLINAQKIVREATSFMPSASKFDINMDGQSEYLFQFDSYNFGVQKKGGMIFEFDVLTNSFNYASAIQRPKNDYYERKLCVDHFFTEKEFMRFKNDCLKPKSTEFPLQTYEEGFFERTKYELQLKTCIRINQSELQLKKTYTATDNSIQIQYILKNSGKKRISGFFVSESTFAMQKNNEQKIETVVKGELLSLDSALPYFAESGVFSLELTDTESSISFVLDANEESGIHILPLCEESYTEALMCALFWHINLEPQTETEKTIVLSVKSKKKSVTKKTVKK